VSDRFQEIEGGGEGNAFRRRPRPDLEARRKTQASTEGKPQTGYEKANGDWGNLVISGKISKRGRGKLAFSRKVGIKQQASRGAVQ